MRLGTDLLGREQHHTLPCIGMTTLSGTHSSESTCVHFADTRDSRYAEKLAYTTGPPSRQVRALPLAINVSLDNGLQLYRGALRLSLRLSKCSRGG